MERRPARHAAITWKRAKLKSRDFPHLPIKRERVERAIADDVAFLAAHPTRAKRAPREAPSLIDNVTRS
jgi:hypothetical protein